jgi:hypothetical protein
MNMWLLEDGRAIWLLTEEEFDLLPNGTKVISIFGIVATKGVDIIDKDTRYNYLAYGLEE